jgi:tRNA-uridine 2-sulfurtransferase
MNPRQFGRVVVAMSGGVDSSVAAALLLEQGYEVIGMMLRLWSEPGKQDTNRCCTPESMGLARKVAGVLGIPFYALDIQDTFRKTIVEHFVNGYAQGVTPNPCLLCNRQIRFGVLLQHALAVGADYLATGHYARVTQTSTGMYRLLRGIDPSKDQSYVLSVLNQDQLSKALFPVGNFPKSQVRTLANHYGLPVADRTDSQDLCFLAGEDYRKFLQRYAPHINIPGLIKNTRGEILGDHTGLTNYTIGQRKGLGIFYPKPLYVLNKQVTENTLIVGEIHELGQTALLVNQVNWISGKIPNQPLTAQVKIRYKSQEKSALVIPEADSQARVIFEEPLRDITPGQAAVFYVGEECLGGGIIHESWRNQ